MAAAHRQLSTRALALDLTGRLRPRPRTRRACCLLLPAPSAGQRLQASESVSPAGWCGATRSISASGRACRRRRLVVPLDTHVIRVGRCLGLTRYASPGWRDGAATSRRRCARLDPGRSGELRLRALPPRDDERVRRSAARSGRAVSAAWRRAGHACVPRRSRDHPLDGERARARARIRPRPYWRAGAVIRSSRTIAARQRGASRGGTTRAG